MIISKILHHLSIVKIRLSYYLFENRQLKGITTEQIVNYNENKTAIAHHEAGHTIIDYIFTIPIQYVSILPHSDGSSGGVEMATDFKNKLGTNNFNMYELIHCEILEKFCGGIAETKYCGYSNPNGCRTDLAIIKATVKLMVLRNGGDYQETYDRYEKIATKLMDDPIIWSAVQKIAQECIKKKTLYQSDLELICKDIFVGNTIEKIRNNSLVNAY